jgi:D-galacturonate reductase
MGTRGEVTVDQAHRGYSLATDIAGHASLNPLFMKYAPSDGRFAGQAGYGYRSIEAFIEAAAAISSSGARPADYDATLATASATRTTTAILEAGRRSLDAGGRRVILDRGDEMTAVHVE